MAVVQDDSKWGIINRDGKFIVNPQFEGGKPFRGALAAFKQNGLWG
jgi:hypothetical protein